VTYAVKMPLVARAESNIADEHAQYVP